MSSYHARAAIARRITSIVIIVTLPRLPPTHLEYSFIDSLAFAVRGLDVRGLAVTNVSSIVVVGGSICCILQGLEAPGGPASNEVN